MKTLVLYTHDHGVLKMNQHNKIIDAIKDAKALAEMKETVKVVVVFTDLSSEEFK